MSASRPSASLPKACVSVANSIYSPLCHVGNLMMQPCARISIAKGLQLTNHMLSRLKEVELDIGCNAGEASNFSRAEQVKAVTVLQSSSSSPPTSVGLSRLRAGRDSPFKLLHNAGS